MISHSKSIAWLHSQLPELVQKGILTPDTAQQLQLYYPQAKQKVGITLALVFFSLIGALLIGGGILMLLAHNWQQLGRPTRTVLALLPLLLAQGITATVLLKKVSKLYCEAAGAFHALAVATSIALIAQTYHMPGSFDSFMMIWMILILPLVYMLSSLTTIVIYALGILAWLTHQKIYDGAFMGFWLYSALAAPYLYVQLRSQIDSGRKAFLQWTLILYLAIATGILINQQHGGFWIPIYAFFWGFLYKLGLTVKNSTNSFWINPAKSASSLALIFMLFLLSWQWPWRGIQWSYLHWGAPSVWMHVFVMVVMGIVFMLFKNHHPKYNDTYWLKYATPIIVLAYVLTLLGQEAFAALMINIFIVGVALRAMFYATQHNSLRTLNIALALFSFLIWIRFFDSSFSFIAKGLVFIFLGILFLVCNVFLARKKEQIRAE
jgi:uncharacterized membrane protein